RASKLPAGKTFDAWEPDRSVIPAATQNALRSLEWIDRAEVLCVCGPSTIGRSDDRTLGPRCASRTRTRHAAAKAAAAPSTSSQLIVTPRSF
ncbi:MAG TPA: hypothetical protein VME22_25395, partial [Solirubrobacteraceae bacterium]|nr:hypothetical protein [Solirubrobacteraceae bacterium]